MNVDKARSFLRLVVPPLLLLVAGTAVVGVTEQTQTPSEIYASGGMHPPMVDCRQSWNAKWHWRITARPLRVLVN